MQAYVIEYIPRDEEESELVQAGNDWPDVCTKIAMIMLLGQRIVGINKNGRPVESAEFTAILVSSARMLAIERLGTSVGLSLDESYRHYGTLFGVDADLLE